MYTFPCCRELKTVSGGADGFEDFEGTIAFFSKFLHGSKGSNVGAFEPYFRTNFKRGKIVPFGIIVRFHDSGGFSEGSDGIISSNIQLGCSVRGGRVVRGERVALPSRHIAEHKVERGVLYSGVKST